MDPKIFKAYDIRGLCPGQISRDDAYLIGQAVVIFTKAKTVVVGRDMRRSGDELVPALMDGILSQGADVVSIGQVATPMMYYAVGDYELRDAGVMVTASHNPAEYNGFKLCFGDAIPIGANTGIYDVRDIALKGPYPEKPRGQVVETDVSHDYLDRLFTAADIGKLKHFKVVADCGNGMEGPVIGRIFDRLPTCELTGLFLEPDGSFPNHEANPLKEETLDVLKKKISEIGADLGIAFDGDADRVGLVDERGRTVRGDIIEALLAPIILGKTPGATVVYDVRESMIVPEVIEKAGGRPLMAPVGHGLVKPIMKKENAAFGGELSNHYYFRDFKFAESSDLVLLMTLKLLSETGKKLSELVDPLMCYFHSGEINSEVADKDAVFRAVDAKFGAAATRIIRIDGVRYEFTDPAHPESDWWFSVRASNTEPLLRLNLEAKNREKMEKMRDELLKIIRE